MFTHKNCLMYSTNLFFGGKFNTRYETTRNITKQNTNLLNATEKLRVSEKRKENLVNQ